MTSFPIIPTLDLVTPALTKRAGVLIGAMNHEPVAAGCRRVDGYERFDGQPRPSAATYYVLDFDAGVGAITAGQVVTGLTSGATGKALVNAVVTSGSYGASDAAGYLVLTVVSGTFQDNEPLQVAAVTKCVANGTAALEGADNDTDHDTWSQLAIETARALIAAIPGSGVARGVCSLDGQVFGIRDNAGGTAAQIYKATTSGWVLQSLGRQLAFTSGGTYEIQEGDVITGATSGCTATITRVRVTSGDWTTGDAVGFLIFASQSTAFVAENLNVGANLNVATVAGNSTANSLPAGGRYEFDVEAFSEIGSEKRIYGVNGVGPAFEWDGTVFVSLANGEPNDTPTHLRCHKQHLVLGYEDGRMIVSAIGNPYNYEALLGAQVSKHKMGGAFTALIGPYAGALFCCGRDRTAILYGSDSEDFTLQENAKFAGAKEWTAQLLDQPLYVDDAGLRKASSGSQFGDFSIGTLTFLIQPILDGYRAGGITPVGSCVVKAKSQYRVFFSDGSGLAYFIGRKDPMILPFDLGRRVYCITNCQDASGQEEIYFGDENGMIYQLDKGLSFDGQAIEAYIRPAFNHFGEPERNKRFTRGVLQGEFPDKTRIYYVTEYDGGEPTTPPSVERSIEIAGNGGYWSQNDNWNDFDWSAAYIGKMRFKLFGKGANLSTAFITSDAYKRPYTLTSLDYQARQRGIDRRVN